MNAALKNLKLHPYSEFLDFPAGSFFIMLTHLIELANAYFFANDIRLSPRACLL